MMERTAVRRGLLLWACGLAVLAGNGPARAQDDDKLANRVAKIDARFVKALEGLAKKYDGEKDPEAAHFFAECALGLGSKVSEIVAIRTATELDVYLGKVRGGKVLEKTGSIRSELDSPALDYKKLVQELIEESDVKDKLPPYRPPGAPAPRGLSEKGRKVLYDCVVRYELARGAHEYIRVTQEFNQLRRAMGLRAVLWDFQSSQKLVLGCFYATETGDTDHMDAKSQELVFHCTDAKFPAVDAAGVWEPLASALWRTRSVAIARADLLNPNARRLWLAHWEAMYGVGRSIKGFHGTAYRIPQLPYREDIPTPSQRYGRNTVVKDWIDTEDTIEIAGRKVPFVRYPYDGEPDAPWAFSHGRGSEGLRGKPAWFDPPSKDIDQYGIPIMLRFFGEVTFKDLEARLEDERGKEVPCRVYTERDTDKVDLAEPWPTVLLLPKEHLKQGATYTVMIMCKLPGIPFTKSWRFTTRKR